MISNCDALPDKFYQDTIFEPLNNIVYLNDTLTQDFISEE